MTMTAREALDEARAVVGRVWHTVLGSDAGSQRALKSVEDGIRALRDALPNAEGTTVFGNPLVDALRDKDQIVMGGLLYCGPVMRQAADLIERLEQQQADQSMCVLVPIEEYDRLKSLQSAVVQRPQGHDAAQARLAECVREIEIICDEFGYDHAEWLAEKSAENAVGLHHACIFCKGTGRTDPMSTATRELCERTVEAQRNDTRTDDEKVADGVKFVMGPGDDEGTRLAPSSIGTPEGDSEAEVERRAREWDRLHAAIGEYVENYEWRGDDGDYTPTAREKALVYDVIAGLWDGDVLEALCRIYPVRSRLAPSATRQSDRDKIIEEVMEAIASRQLTNPQDDEDRAYDVGVTDSYCAVKRLLSQFARPASTSESGAVDRTAKP